jgi:hypothetical protein
MRFIGGSVVADQDAAFAATGLAAPPDVGARVSVDRCRERLDRRMVIDVDDRRLDARSAAGRRAAR